MTANVSFDGTDLSTLGFSLLALDGRAMAPYEPSSAEIIGRNAKADLGGKLSLDSQTQLTGGLSANTNVWSAFNHANFLARFDQIKALLDPELGFKRLVITGDLPSRYRWCRFLSMSTSEVKPVFKLPFQKLDIVFENLEPFWRETATPFISAAATFTVPNTGPKITRPTITILLGTPIHSLTELFTWDGIGFSWDGAKIPLETGDQISIDAENLVVLSTSFESGIWYESIRAYVSTSTKNSGFPALKAVTGSAVANRGPHTFTVNSDRIYP